MAGENKPVSAGNAAAEKKELRRSFALSYVLIMIGNGLNFLFQIVMGRMLPVAEYGSGNASISIITNLSIVFLPFTIIMCREVVVQKEDRQKRSRIFWELMAAALVLSAVLMIAVLPAGAFRLGSYSFSMWVWMGAAAVFYGAYLILQSFFQGLEDFGRHGLIAILFFGLKIVLFAVFVLLGLTSASVSGSLILAGILTILIGACWLKQGAVVTLEKPKRNLFDFRSAYGATFILQLLYSLYINGGDILLIRGRFGDETAGLYSSITIIGKVLVFLVLALSGVLLPEVTKRKSEGRDARGLILKITALCAGFALIYAAGIWLIGYRMIPVLLGDRYRIGRDLVLPTMLFYGSACIMGLFYNYMLAIGAVKQMIAFLGGSLLLTLAGIWWMPGLNATLLLMGGVLGAGMALCLAYIVRRT